jgi:acetyl esterase/lipase
VVVLVHGGYWRRGYDRRLEHAVAADLAARGLLVWNLEYAPSDRPWPRTLTDVALGYDLLARGRLAARVDPARVVVAGHSAGGHLALWLASRHRLPAGRPGASDPAVGPGGAVPRPVLAVAQAPVACLAEGSRRGLGGGAVDALVGGPPDLVPERYRVADPVALLPTGVRTVLVHGEDDDVVPISQSEQYVAAARAAGDDSVLVRVEGGHMVHLDPCSAALRALHDALADLSA